MSRLQTQLHRLYHPQPGSPIGDLAKPDLLDAEGRTRALVLTLARPADWDAVARVWQGVQVDLNLPAPAIAVNGQDGYQLWFSTAAPLAWPDARAFLTGLQARYWPDVSPARVRIWPVSVPALTGSTLTQAPLDTSLDSPFVPALIGDTGQWSAFVSRDLAPVFTDSPWLDIPPNPEGQADLLTPLRSIETSDLQSALALLATPATSGDPTAPSTSTSNGAQAAPQPAGTATAPPLRSPQDDPRRFLLEVMNNPTVELALRIEAAKALLCAPHSPARGAQ